jgi:hypothetical protein
MAIKKNSSCWLEGVRFERLKEVKGEGIFARFFSFLVH